MSGTARPNVWKPAVVVLSVLFGAGSIVAGGELQQVIQLAAAVTAALVCFDSALNRRNRSFVPWLLLCAAVLAKVIPSVRHGLAGEDTLLFERWDHLGTVLSALLVLLALVMVAVLAAPTSTAERVRIAGLVALGSLASGVAGATLTYSYDAGFGSESVARLYETLGWAFAGGLLIAAVLALGRVAQPTITLAVVVAFASVTACLTAWSSAGRSIDVGWWAVSWTILVFGALAFDKARLVGQSRYFGSLFPLTAAVAAVGSLLCVVASFIFGSTWSLGWLVLLLASAGLGAFALMNRSTQDSIRQDATDQAFVGAIEAERSAPLGDLLAFPRSQQSVAVPPVAEPSVAVPPVAEQSVAVPPVAVPPVAVPVAVPPVAEPVAVPPVAEPVAEIVVPTSLPAQPAVPAPAVAPATLSPAVSNAPTAPAHRQSVAADLTGGLASHHFDPPTMLLSNAGLQEAVLREFSKPARAQHETALLFIALRNSAEIEVEHGRVVLDDVIRQLAQRLRSELPDAVCARFAPTAFAALLVGQTPPNDQFVERSTRTLLQLLTDVSSNNIVVRVDVVGGLAQCKENEIADSLVGRANDGLERAVRSAEPTLVAMP